MNFGGGQGQSLCARRGTVGLEFASLADNTNWTDRVRALPHSARCWGDFTRTNPKTTNH